MTEKKRLWFKVTVKTKGKKPVSFKTTGFNKKHVISNFTEAGKKSVKKGETTLKRSKSLFN